MDASQRDALLALNLVSGLGPTLTRRCLGAMGSAQAILEAGPHTLANVEGIGLSRAREIQKSIDSLADGKAVAREKELVEELGVTLLVHGEPDYPRGLAGIPDAPPLLYVRGQIQPEDALALAIVGARRCTQYGREQADRLAGLCSQSGLCIVSGGAYGIDAAAHRAVLRSRGRTIAVLGSGLAKPYPTDHTELFDQIADGHGAVVSELPMTSPPIAENFPRRNRIISGLALGVLVVEASLRSGALITARLATEEHGREVMALPGKVDSPVSAGCHKIIREGWATLVTSAADVLDALGEAGQALKAELMLHEGRESEPEGASLFTNALSEPQRKIVEALAEPQSFDQLVARTQLPAGAVQAELTMLQIRSVIAREPDGLFRRKR